MEHLSASLAPEPPHHSNLKYFNPWPSSSFPSLSQLFSSGGWVGLPDCALRDKGVEDVKVVKPDWGRRRLREMRREGQKTGKKRDLIAATWLGHAGAFVEIPLSPPSAGPTRPLPTPTLKCLFDPIFSDRAGPGIGPKRLRPSPCTVEDLPGVDMVLISHNHYDHLDLATIRDVVRLYPRALYFVPLGNKPWFLSLSIPPTNIYENDWWDEVDLPSSFFTGSSPFSSTCYDEHEKREERIRVTCVPAQHTSGRGICDQRSTLWCGWLVERLVPVERGSSSSASSSLAFPSTPSSSYASLSANPPHASRPLNATTASYLSWARRAVHALSPVPSLARLHEETSSRSDGLNDRKNSREGWIRRGAVFHAGDTGYRPFANSPTVCPAFASLGQHFGPLDLAFVPIWRGGTMGFVSAMSLRLRHENLPCATHGSPEDAVAIHLDVRSRNTIGVHFGTFEGSNLEALEALTELEKERRKEGVGRLKSSGSGKGKEGKRGRLGWLDLGETWVVRAEPKYVTQ